MNTIRSCQTLAIIPARGGSKGLPRKNLVMLGDMPLVAWSIKAALHCPSIDRVVVSTDDEEIAEVSIAFGAEVPFLRPALYAGDKSSLGDAITYTIQQLDGTEPDAVITLLPTHPFRSANLMETLSRKIQNYYGKVKTVAPITVHASSHLVMHEDGGLDSVWKEHFPECARPSAVLHRPYGLFDAYAPSRPKNRLFVYELTNPVELIDIDTQEDLLLAQQIVLEGLFDFGWQP